MAQEGLSGSVPEAVSPYVGETSQVRSQENSTACGGDSMGKGPGGGKEFSACEEEAMLQGNIVSQKQSRRDEVGDGQDQVALAL